MRFAVVLAVLLCAPARAADALTIRDVIELSRAGLGDEVLLALIDVDAGVFASDTATLKALKDAGVSERVIIALIRSGREKPIVPDPLPAALADDPPPPPPQVVVVDHHHQERQPVFVPVYVPVSTGRARLNRGDGHAITTGGVNTPYVPFQSGLPVTRPAEHPETREPVYWGFGGKLRPDAWGQPKDGDTEKPREKDRR